MKPAFSVLVVHGDGSRVLRVGVPRAVVYGVLGVLGAVTCVSGGHVLARDGELALLRRHLDAQRAIVATFQTRLAGMRSEIAAWTTAHAKMRAAVGLAAAGGSTSGAGAAADVPSAPAEELDLLANTVAREGPRLRELESAIVRTGDLLRTLPLRWPVQGPVRSEYGRRRSPWTGKPEDHEGLDIGSPPGTPIASPAAGRVVAAGAGHDYGRRVLLDHGNGVKSLYGHLKQVDVKVGQQVEEGQVIGRVGSTGRSTGPHLHYEVRVDGKPVDPRKFLWAH